MAGDKRRVDPSPLDDQYERATGGLTREEVRRNRARAGEFAFAPSRPTVTPHAPASSAPSSPTSSATPEPIRRHTRAQGPVPSHNGAGGSMPPGVVAASHQVFHGLPTPSGFDALPAAQQTALHARLDTVLAAHRIRTTSANYAYKRTLLRRELGL